MQILCNLGVIPNSERTYFTVSCEQFGQYFQKTGQAKAIQVTGGHFLTDASELEKIGFIMELVFAQFITGLALGMVFFIISVGLSLVFGVLKVLNISHASLYMLGAFLCYSITNQIGPEWFFLTLIIAPLGVAVTGGIIEVLFIRKIYKSDILYQLILTFGLILIIGDICKFLWGADFHVVEMPKSLRGYVTLFGVNMGRYQLFLVMIGPIILLFISLLLQKTKLGRIIKAITYSREMSSALGINVATYYTSVFMFACWLSGLGGTLIAPYASVFVGMDATVTMECFIIMIIGGLGSILGAFLGAIIYGLSYSLGILVLPKFSIAFGFIAMAVVLIIMPKGLLGKDE